MGVIIWRWIKGKSMAGGFKMEGTLKTALCKLINGVKGNEYHTVLG